VRHYYDEWRPVNVTASKNSSNDGTKPRYSKLMDFREFDISPEVEEAFGTNKASVCFCGPTSMQDGSRQIVRSVAGGIIWSNLSAESQLHEDAMNQLGRSTFRFGSSTLNEAISAVWLTSKC